MNTQGQKQLPMSGNCHNLHGQGAETGGREGPQTQVSKAKVTYGEL